MLVQEQIKIRRRTILRALVVAKGTMARFYQRYQWMVSPLAIAFGVRVILLLVAQIGIRLIPGQQNHGLFSIWRSWDANWYLSIAQNGYQYPTSPVSNVNFFPLYPLLIWIGQHLLDPILGSRSDLIVAMAISWIAFGAACVVLYWMVVQRFDRQAATIAIVLLATFPFSFYYGAPYVESLYLLLAVVAFYGIERRRWWIAGMAALLAGALHPPGLIVGACVVLAYVLDWIQRRRPLRWDVLALALTPLGTLAYVLYCWFRFGEPFAYIKASQQGWHAGHLQLNIVRMFVFLLAHPREWIVSGDFNTIVWTIYAFIVIAALVALVFIYRKLGLVYAFFTLASIAAPIFNFPIPSSTGRHISVIFPIFIVLALYLRNRPVLREVTIIGFSVFLGLFTLLFVMFLPVY